jgi:Zn-dependent protease
VFSSFRIGSLFGITVRVHFLFLVMLLLIGPRIGPEGGPFGILILLGLFGLVLLHELGHSLVAMRFGIRVVDITLWPLGGMARMSHIPEDTKTEALIAIAGPAVNFALLLLALPLFLVIGPEDGAAFAILFGFAWANFALGAFNLIPAFPMDGGRVLRALLGRNGDWVEATRKAVHVGRILALFGGLVGFFAPEVVPFASERIWLAPVIALWLWWVGGQELAAVKRRHATRDPLAGVADFLRRAGFPFPPPAGTAPAGAPPGGPRDARGFRTFGGAPFAGAPFAGAGADQEPTPPPPAPAEPSRTAGGNPGFTDDDVERLERFRGPLRQFRPDGDEA